MNLPMPSIVRGFIVDAGIVWCREMRQEVSVDYVGNRSAPG